MGNICDVYKEPNDIKTKLKVIFWYIWKQWQTLTVSKTFDEEFHIVMQPHRHIVKINSP